MAKSSGTPGSGTGNQIVGKVFILHGTVKAVSPDGAMRVLAPNSPIYAYDRIKEDAATGKPILPPYEELKQHSIERAKILGLETTAKTSKRSYRSEGTSTDIVPCPKCSDKKRVDKNTKRFRCKKCGLNQTYPF